MLEPQVGPLTVAGSVEYDAQTRSSARSSFGVRCTSGDKEMRGKAKREAVTILKKCNVLQFQGTAETMTALLLERDVYVRASICQRMRPTPRYRQHPAERMASAHSANVLIARSFER